MNTLALMAVALLSGLTFGGLGYLIARTVSVPNTEGSRRI